MLGLVGMHLGNTPTQPHLLHLPPQLTLTSIQQELNNVTSIIPVQIFHQRINPSPPPLATLSLRCIALSSSSSHSASPRLQDQAVPSNTAPQTTIGDLFQYSSLPSHEHFRILELLPSEVSERGGDGGGIHCRLHTERFADAEDKYAAISYVWGNPNNRVRIVCDGRVVEVTVNLADALRHIRDHTECRFVWADAVCINQEDNEEKGHQVKRMGKVYENAEEVLVWLGRDSEGIAEDCFNLIRETNEYLDHQLEIHGHYQHIPPVTRASPISFDKSRWSKVEKLVEMPWFCRLWVLQEAALAKQCELLWGENQLSLAELCELSCYLDYRPDLSNLVGQIRLGEVVSNFTTQCTYQTMKSWMGTKPLIKIQRGVFQNTIFLDILDTGRRLNVSFEVDRVYAFLGSPSARKYGDEALLVEPDYSKSIQEVYVETACSLLAHPREAPYVLAQVDHHRNECMEGTTLRIDGAFPSWVPRWDKGSWQYSMSFPQHWYRAGGFDKKFNAAVQTNKSLLLPATIFDRVVWTSNVLNEDNLGLDPDLWDEDTKTADKPFIDLLFTEVQQAFYQHCCDRYSEPLSADTVFIEDAFSLTMVRHYASDPPERFDLVEHQQDFEAYLRAARQVTGTNSTQTEASDAGQDIGGGSPFTFASSLEYTHNRRFAITESGRFGLVSGLSQPNDVCSIFPGMQVPLILRPREDGRYGLVGDSYVHGVMAGEVMEQLEKGEVKLDNIFLV